MHYHDVELETGQRGSEKTRRSSILRKKVTRAKEKKLGRVEKLLRCGLYPGLTTDVILEAPCFQLGETGVVYRHVFVGLTSREFVMASQILHDTARFPEMRYRANIDLDLEGMDLVCSAPLNVVRFFIVDDRSRKFAVCTSLGKISYFEMCNTADGSDEVWTKWREMIREQDNPSSYGYRTWRVSMADVRDARKMAYNIEIEEDVLKFIKRSVTFCGIDSIGVQYSLTNLNSDKFRTLHSLRHQGESRSEILGENRKILQDVCIYSFFQEDPKRRYDPRRSDSFVSVPVKMQAGSCVRSQSDYVLGLPDRALPLQKTVHFKFAIISFIAEAIPTESHQCVDIVNLKFHKWGMKRTTLNQLHRIWKLRHAERLARERQRALDLSDSDESISDLIDEYSQVKKKVNPLERWQLAIKEIKRREKPSLEQCLRNVAFPTCDVIKYKGRRWMCGATPADFAGQVSQIHIDLFMKITELDLIKYFDNSLKCQPSSVRDLLNFSRGLSLLIVKEVLESKSKTELNRRFKFFLEACRECHDSNDLHSTSSVITGIRLLPVTLVGDTWSTLIRNFPALFRDYMSIGAMYSHLTSRRYTDKLRDSQRNPPYFPWMQHFLWHIQHALRRTLDCVKEKKHRGLGVQELIRRTSKLLSSSSGLKAVISKQSGINLTGGSWMAFHKEVTSTSKGRGVLRSAVPTHLIKNTSQEQSKKIASYRSVGISHKDMIKGVVWKQGMRMCPCIIPEGETTGTEIKTVTANPLATASGAISKGPVAQNTQELTLLQVGRNSEQVAVVAKSEQRRPLSYLEDKKGKKKDLKEPEIQPADQHQSGSSNKRDETVSKTDGEKTTELFDESKSQLLSIELREKGNEGTDERDISAMKERTTELGVEIGHKSVASVKSVSLGPVREESNLSRRESDLGSLLVVQKMPAKDTVIDEAVRAQLSKMSRSSAFQHLIGKDDSHPKNAMSVHKKLSSNNSSSSNTSNLFDQKNHKRPRVKTNENKVHSVSHEPKNTNFSSSTGQNNIQEISTTPTDNRPRMKRETESSFMPGTQRHQGQRLGGEVHQNRTCSPEFKAEKCCVCHEFSCMFANCGLEKLVELQLICLSFRHRGSRQLYNFITDESRKCHLNSL